MHSPMRLPQRCPKPLNNDVRRSMPLMGTVVTIHAVGHEPDPQATTHREEAVERAFEWFCRVEECCTRFEPQSEVMQLAAQVGVPVRVSTIPRSACVPACLSRRGSPIAWFRSRALR